jgi:nitroreductase
MRKKIWKKSLAIGMVAVSLGIAYIPPISALYEKPNHYPLPSPLNVDMFLEQAICRRLSVRRFKEDLVTDEELSTILWAAYGFSDGRQNIHGIEMAFASQIYVLKEDATYKYDAWNHSLTHWRSGDFRDIGQYDDAQVKLGIVWDSHRCNYEEKACAEIGEIGQNVYFMANALDLGTVATATNRDQLRYIGLPSNEIPKIIMPIGHPKDAYYFTYEPILSKLPVIQNSSMSLSTAIQERNEAIAWRGELTLHQQHQVVWSSYGYSYFIDNVNNRRHRTVPSAVGSYPLSIFISNISGIYQYIPEEHSYTKIDRIDKRWEIAQASQPFIASAPCIIISVLDTRVGDSEMLWCWYYEAGASAYNVLLEATAWNLSANIISPIDTNALLTILELDDNCLPLFIIPIGEKGVVNDKTSPQITMSKPREKYLYIFDKEITPIGITVLVGTCTAEAEVIDDYAIQIVKFFVDGAEITEMCLPPYCCNVPVSILPRKHILKVRAYDYRENVASVTIEYIKII